MDQWSAVSKPRGARKLLTDASTWDSNRLHCAEHSLSRPWKYKFLTRWSTVLQCIRVTGWSGNAIEVDEGKAFLVFDGVMSVNLFKGLGEEQRGNRSPSRSFESWSRQEPKNRKNADPVLENSRVKCR